MSWKNPLTEKTEKSLSFISILLLVALIFIYPIYTKWINKDTNNIIEEQSKEISEIKQSIEITQTSFLLQDQSCEFIYSGDYKYLDIANTENPIYTPKDVKWDNYNLYTKKIKIIGNIDNAYLCIISDISDKKDSYNDYRKKGAYNFVTYLFFGDISYAWQINVACSKKDDWTCQYYDYDSNNSKPANPILNWKFRSEEAPYKYFLDLKKTIIADKENWWFKYIAPINILKNWNEINVWWFMSQAWKEDYRASSITTYRIIYKWEGNIWLIEKTE